MSRRWRGPSRGGVLLAVLLASGCGSDGEGSSTTSAGAVTTTITTTTTAPLVTREEVVTCLDQAGAAPEDSGLFIIGSADTNVEAVALPAVGQAGSVLLFVFDHDATDEVDYVSESVAPGYAEYDNPPPGNVVVAYAGTPAEADRALVEGCLGGGPATTTGEAPTTVPVSDEEQRFLDALQPYEVPANFPTHQAAIDAGRQFCEEARRSLVRSSGDLVELHDPASRVITRLTPQAFAEAAATGFCPEAADEIVQTGDPVRPS